MTAAGLVDAKRSKINSINSHLNRDGFHVNYVKKSLALLVTYNQNPTLNSLISCVSFEALPVDRLLDISLAFQIPPSSP